MENITRKQEDEAIRMIRENDNILWLSLNYAAEAAQKKRGRVLDALEKKIVASTFDAEADANQGGEDDCPAGAEDDYNRGF
jgi:hypothetical protein